MSLRAGPSPGMAEFLSQLYKKAREHLTASNRSSARKKRKRTPVESGISNGVASTPKRRREHPAPEPVDTLLKVYAWAMVVPLPASDIIERLPESCETTEELKTEFLKLVKWRNLPESFRDTAGDILMWRAFTLHYHKRWGEQTDDARDRYISSLRKRGKP